MGDFTIVSANIRSNPLEPQWAVKQRINVAMELAGEGGAVFFQEMHPSNLPARRRYVQALKDACKVHRFTYRKIDKETPIALSWVHWKILSSGWMLLPKSWLAHVSPARGFTDVIASRSGHTIVHIDLHPVSKGYKGAMHRATHWVWRHTQLVAYQKKLAKAVAAYHKRGYTVCVGGDCNDPNPPLPHPLAVKLNEHGLDHLWAIPAPGKRITNITRHKVAPTKEMDHPILVGSFDIV